MATLYEMTTAAEQLYEMLQNEDIDEQTLTDTIEAMGAEEKLESYVKIIRQLENDSAGYKVEKDRMAAKQKFTEKAIDRMTGSVIQFMTASGQKKAKAGVFDLALSVSRSAQIVNDELLDKQYLIPQDPKVDKAAIRKALLAGETVDGAVLVENTGVRIR